ncbi:MAG TPA: CmcJ/NvfI family oxidoreductase [Croceibacterium sp.]|nr:CmcJ/NvfI family oxidoreductase [Croceibacterium sp.]
MSGTRTAAIAYVRDTGERPRYYANAHEKDTIVVAPQPMAIADMRGVRTSLDIEGCVLVAHRSEVADFADPEQVALIHAPEIVELLKRETGCDEVVVAPRGILRFSERLGENARHDNSHPARFAHVDVSAETGARFRAQSAPPDRELARSAQYNVWRAISGAPQDVPLALCDARSVAGPELLRADAIFDPPGGAPEFSFEGYVVAHDPGHRWLWFSGMEPDEAIVFKTSESDPQRAQCIPHVAFDDPEAPAGAPPRVSIEMRATGYWFA